MALKAGWGDAKDTPLKRALRHSGTTSLFTSSRLKQMDARSAQLRQKLRKVERFAHDLPSKLVNSKKLRRETVEAMRAAKGLSREGKDAAYRWWAKGPGQYLDMD